MKTFVVWVLYISTAWENRYGGGPAIAVIDNIASRQNCEALSRTISSRTLGENVRLTCVAVRKAAP